MLIELVASDCLGIISRRLTIQRLAEFAFNPERGFEQSRLAAQTVLERLVHKLTEKKKAGHSVQDEDEDDLLVNHDSDNDEGESVDAATLEVLSSLLARISQALKDPAS